MRRDPNMHEKLAALIVLHLGIDRERAKSMTARQICALVQWDHYPVAFNAARDLGWSETESHHPTNLQPMLPDDHLDKTRKIDTPQAAKGKRLTKAHQEFRARLLAPEGAAVADVEPKKGRPLKGRGFAGHRRMNGDVVWKWRGSK